MSNRKRAKFAALLVAAVAALAVVWLGQGQPAEAADHTDPPSRVGTIGNPADIGDIYAWHSADGSTLTMVLTFGGPLAPTADQAGNYDATVLYGLHIDNDGDQAPNANIWLRFAQNDLGEWGVQAVGVPGEAAAIEGAVETDLSGAGGAKLYAGLRDDPFFFDLQGFQDTLATQTLAFSNTRDFFAGQNITTVVLEVPMTAALGGGSALSIWATTAEK